MSDAQADKIENAICGLVGADHVRESRPRETQAARIIAEPRDSDEIAAIVRQCEAGHITLAPLGAARTLSEIRATPATLGVSLSRMDRIVAYEPEDMTVIAEAGMTLGVLNQRAAEHGQRLPLDPRNPGAATLGALVAASQAGPLRLSEGTPRDVVMKLKPGQYTPVIPMINPTNHQPYAYMIVKLISKEPAARMSSASVKPKCRSLARRKCSSKWRRLASTGPIVCSAPALIRRRPAKPIFPASKFPAASSPRARMLRI